LRITEEDVINEEMYEEEEDDLPLHYRLLQHRLRTDSADFNRRYLAYMTSQVSMRSALDQAYAQYFPNYDQVVNGGQSSALYMVNPFNGGQTQAPLSPPPPPTVGAQYTGSPYHVPRRGTGNGSVPQSPMSTSTPLQLTVDTSASSYSSREHSNNTPVSSTVPSAITPGSTNSSMSSHPAGGSFFNQWNMQLMAKQQQQEVINRMMAQHQLQSPTGVSSADHDNANEGYPADDNAAFNPFSLSLPPHTQQFLAPVLNSNDPFTSQLLGENHAQSPGSTSSFSPMHAQMPSLQTGQSLFEGSNTVYPYYDDDQLGGTSPETSTPEDDSALQQPQKKKQKQNVQNKRESTKSKAKDKLVVKSGIELKTSGSHLDDGQALEHLNDSYSLETSQLNQDEAWGLFVHDGWGESVPNSQN
jgi:hypothetical protein